MRGAAVVSARGAELDSSGLCGEMSGKETGVAHLAADHAVQVPPVGQIHDDAQPTVVHEVPMAAHDMEVRDLLHRGYFPLGFCHLVAVRDVELLERHLGPIGAVAILRRVHVAERAGADLLDHAVLPDDDGAAVVAARPAASWVRHLVLLLRGSLLGSRWLGTRLRHRPKVR